MFKILDALPRVYFSSFHYKSFHLDKHYCATYASHGIIQSQNPFDLLHFDEGVPS